jgi:sugar phosphate isomerase/epimerase
VAALPDLSVQLYSVREPFERDPGGTLARLAAIGFRRVEPFQLVERAAVLQRALPASGLTVPTAHAHVVGVADPAEVFEVAVSLGVRTVIEPMVDPARWTSRAAVEEVAAELAELAAAAAGHGLRLGYHNHWWELEPEVEGRHAIEVLADLLAPEVFLEIDTYWAAVGGADVPALLGRLSERVLALHVKDGPVVKGEPHTAVGQGVMPVPQILAAAPGAWRVVELDECASDVFAALADSHTYLTSLEGS